MKDSRELEVDLMEIVANLTILCKIKENLNGRIKVKEKLSGNVVIPIKVVLVHTEEEVLLILELVLLVNVIDVVKKVINSLNARNLVKVLVEML